MQIFNSSLVFLPILLPLLLQVIILAAKLTGNNVAAKSLKKIVQHEAYWLVFLQLLCVLFIACLAWLFKGLPVGLSVFAGGMTYGLPNLFFVWLVFGYVGAKQMNKFVIAFFFGEMLKLIISAILFLIIVKYLSLSLLSVLVGFIGSIISFWIVCMWHFSRQDLKTRGG